MQDGEYQASWIPAYAPASDDLPSAGLLRRAFLETPALCAATREAIIVAAKTPEPPALMINRGVAFRSVATADGRRSITDILLPMDIVGLHHAVLGWCDHEIVAADTVSYRLLPAAKVRKLMRDPRVALRVFAVSAECQWRIDRHLAQVIRSDARGRLASMILGIYERLRRRDLIVSSTFDLPLTHEQIGNHLGLTTVHVSRTLRRLREEQAVIVERQAVTILDLDKLRRIVLAPTEPVLETGVI